MNTHNTNAASFLIVSFLLILTGCLSCSPPNLKSTSLADGQRNRVVNTAKRYLGVPYRYGGVNPNGFDCSGLVMYVYKRNGLDLPRAAVDQYRSGRPVPRRALRPGDLVFFSIRGGRISHVGIYTGSSSFIHAPSSGKKVSFARLDNVYWKKRYVGAVTYFSPGGRVRYAILNKK